MGALIRSDDCRDENRFIAGRSLRPYSTGAIQGIGEWNGCIVEGQLHVAAESRIVAFMIARVRGSVEKAETDPLSIDS